MSLQKLILIVCAAAAGVWFVAVAVRAYEQEVADKAGCYWVLAGRRQVTVGFSPTYVYVSPGLSRDAFERTLDQRMRERIAEIRRTPSDFLPPDWAAGLIADLQYFLRTEARDELYVFYQKDVAEDRARAWARVEDWLTRAAIPPALSVTFGAAMWWALAGFASAGARGTRVGFVRLCVVAATVWASAYAVFVPIEDPVAPLVFTVHDRRGARDFEMPGLHFDRTVDLGVRAGPDRDAISMLPGYDRATFRNELVQCLLWYKATPDEQASLLSEPRFSAVYAMYLERGDKLIAAQQARTMRWTIGLVSFPLTLAALGAALRRPRADR